MDKDTDQTPQGGKEKRDEEDHPHGDPAARKDSDGADKNDDDAAEEAARDSFPGSDAPAW
ncbi:MAG: hypothetical protein M3198_04735 [Actinomycetota bacterium]|nr:hypothetical protein [Actinomycetota bacterium]